MRFSSVSNVSNPIVATVRAFSKTERIPCEPDVLWEIARGIVKTITWTESGKVIGLGYWGPGDLVGLPLMAIAPYEAVCTTQVLARRLTLNDIALPTLLTQFKIFQKLIWITQQETVAEQVWTLLIWLSEKFPGSDNQDFLIDLRFTHQELAELAGTSRVTVTRLLKQFEYHGILLRQDKRYLLTTQSPNLHRLMSLAPGKASIAQIIPKYDREF
jgi:CRP-like cAMP-binding protein